MKDYLTTGEVAAYFGWSTRFVDGLVRGERIPALEINGQLRFRREDLIDWLSQKIQTLDAMHIAELERRFGEDLSAGLPLSQGDFQYIAALIPDNGIVFTRKPVNKAEVLQELVEVAYSTGKLLDRDHLLSSLLDRESLLSTAIPGGIAICHPRRPIPSAIEDNLLCILRTTKPVEFGSLDGKGTSLFFLLCSIDDRSHLHGLARLARILRPEVITALTEAEQVEDVRRILIARELEII